MTYLRASFLLLAFSLIAPITHARQNTKLEYLGATNIEQYFAADKNEYSNFFVSKQLLDSTKSKKITNWPKEIYAYTYKDGEIDKGDKQLLSRDRRNLYSFNSYRQWKTIPLHNDFVLLLSTTESNYDGLISANIYKYADQVFKEVNFVTEDIYDVLKNSSVDWQLTQLNYKSKKLNHWLIDGSLDKFVKSLNQYIDSQGSVYSGKRYKVLSKSASDEYKTYLSYLRPAYHAVQTLNSINNGKAMTGAEVNSFIYSELLPTLAAFYNKYQASEKYKNELFYQETLDTYKNLQKGGETVLLELKSLALRNVIDKQLEAQQRYTQLEDYSPIVRAVASEDITKVRKALSDYKDVNAHYKNWTAINQAAQDGFFDALKLLVESGGDIEVRARNKTPLLSAAANNRLEAMHYLIDQGADVNARVSDSLNSALIIAAKNNRAEMVRILLENGADLWAENYNGDSAWAWAKHKNNKETIAVFEEFNGRDGYQAFQAIDNNNYSSFRRAVNNMDNLYQLHPENYDAFLLSNAAWHGRLEMVQLLIDKGVNINLCNKVGPCAILQAVAKDHLEVVKLFVQSGADLNVQPTDGYAALHSAAYRGHIAVLKYLLAQEFIDAKVLSRAHQGTPLHDAVLANQTEATKILVADPAYRNSSSVLADKHGNTPLIELFRFKHDNRAIFNTLQKQPWSDISHQNKEGKTAYDYAKEAGMSRYLNELRVK